MTPDAPAIAKLVAKMRARIYVAIKRFRADHGLSATSGPMTVQSAEMETILDALVAREREVEQLREQLNDEFPHDDVLDLESTIADLELRLRDHGVPLPYDNPRVTHRSVGLLQAANARAENAEQDLAQLRVNAGARLDEKDAEIARLAGELEEARRERDEARAARNAAILEMSACARRLGEAQGKLQISEAVGILDGWRDRTTAAEARAAKLRETVERLCGAIKPFAKRGEMVAEDVPDEERIYRWANPSAGELRRAAAERTRAVAEAEEGRADG